MLSIYACLNINNMKKLVIYTYFVAPKGDSIM